MVFGDKRLGVCGYELVREGGEDVLKVNCVNCNYTPSIEDNALCMSRTIAKLIEVPSVTRIVFSQRRNYTYDYEQVQVLVEIGNLYNHLIKQKGFLRLAARYNEIRFFLNLLTTDTLGAYVRLRRLLREEKVKITDRIYIGLLENLVEALGKTKLVVRVKDKLEGYIVGDRVLYKEIFRPVITPNFILTRLMAEQPLNAEELDSYNVNESNVAIFDLPNDVKYLYHLTPPEFKISEDKYELLDLARSVLAEHEPRAEEFIDPEKMRQTFFNIGRDLLLELAEQRRIELSLEEANELANILVRYTVGFGLIEVLLEDKKIQDITVNGPIGQTPIFIVHEDYADCVTNIVPSREDALSWATKLRMLSGRPLDEANPVLDTELRVPGARARVAVISSPLNPWGLAYALRRHRDVPWTLPLFVRNKMISPLAAGLISFLIDGSRTLLIGGTRSSGKTSFLGACLIEIMRKYRVISVEDTLELPTETLRRLGYNIQPMKVQSAIAKATAEMSADEGIRTSLRMGDSCLIIGEIRSVEAKALFEAMRIGAMANVVAGTVHGDSPYGVFDRIVNDLGVPKTSFKAADIVLICNPIKSPDGLHRWRRVTQIAEVRKGWEEDPLRERGFVDLMTYDSKVDRLEPSSDLMNGESDVLKAIGSTVKEWAGSWDAIWDNVLLRTKIKESLVNYAEKSKMLDLLEAGFVIRTNDQFHKICDSVYSELGSLDSKRIFNEWENWFKREVKKRKLKVRI